MIVAGLLVAIIAFGALSALRPVPRPPAKLASHGVSGPLAATDAEIYRFLGAYFLHQDQLSWARVQSLIPVEAGALASGFAVRNAHLAALILLLGSWLVYRIYLVIRRDWEIQWHIFANILEPAHDQRNLKVRPIPKHPSLSGQVILRRVIAGIMAVDWSAALLFLLQQWHVRLFGLERLVVR
jgi:hypothetical protein